MTRTEGPAPSSRGCDLGGFSGRHVECQPLVRAPRRWSDQPIAQPNLHFGTFCQFWSPHRHVDAGGSRLQWLAGRNGRERAEEVPGWASATTRTLAPAPMLATPGRRKRVQLAISSVGQTSSRISAMRASLDSHQAAEDRLISIFLKQSPASWPSLVMHSEQWPKMASAVFRRLGEMTEGDSAGASAKQLQRLARDLCSIHADLESHEGTLRRLCRVPPADWRGFVAARRSDLSPAFFLWLDARAARARASSPTLPNRPPLEGPPSSFELSKSALQAVASSAALAVQAHDACMGDAAQVDRAKTELKSLLSLPSLASVQGALSSLREQEGLSPALITLLARAAYVLRGSGAGEGEVGEEEVRFQSAQARILARYEDAGDEASGAVPDGDKAAASPRSRRPLPPRLRPREVPAAIMRALYNAAVVEFERDRPRELDALHALLAVPDDDTRREYLVAALSSAAALEPDAPTALRASPPRFLALLQNLLQALEGAAAAAKGAAGPAAPPPLPLDAVSPSAQPGFVRVLRLLEQETRELCRGLESEAGEQQARLTRRPEPHEI